MYGTSITAADHPAMPAYSINPLNTEWTQPYYILEESIFNFRYIRPYEGCSKWNAYFYLETSNFKLAQKYSFHALEVLPVARHAKFQPMYPLLEGVTVRWFRHSNKVLMNGRSKCLSGLVFPPSKECFQFRKKKKSHGARSGEYGGWGKTVTFYFFKNAVTIAEVWAGALSCRRRTCLKPVAGRRFW